MNFKDKRVLITGGNGFIGSAIGKALANLGARVETFDIRNPTMSNVNKLSELDESFQRRPDIVFHLAAQTEVRKADDNPHHTYRTNVQGTLNVLEACREYRPAAIVIASTDKVYGDQGDSLVSESSRFFHNADIYSSSKQLADEMAEDYARVYGLPLRILRCANTYGPGQKNKTTLLTNSLNKLVKKEVPVLYSDSVDSVREWLFIDDAVQAYLLAAQDAAERRLNWYGAGAYAYNVGAGQRLTNHEALTTLLLRWSHKVGGEAGNYLIQNVTHRPQIASQPHLSIAKFRAAFPQWSPVTFTAGIDRTIAWHLQEGEIL